jgi:hypothetical protein
MAGGRTWLLVLLCGLAGAAARAGRTDGTARPEFSGMCRGAGATVRLRGLRLRGGFDVVAGQGDFVREVMEVPANRIGIIIGRQGGTIREIGRQAGANLWVDQKTNLPGEAAARGGMTIPCRRHTMQAGPDISCMLQGTPRDSSISMAHRAT